MSRDTITAAGDLVGRLLLAALFVLEGVSKPSAYGAATAYVQAYGVWPQLLPLAIALEIGGGCLIALGWHTRAASLALAAFCAFAAFVFHTRFGDRNQLIHFEKDIALAGAFLIVAARGPGAYSLDRWRVASRLRSKRD